MKLTVLTNTFNEGPRVRATCEQFLDAGADEVIVCADGTTDGSCDHLPSRVIVVRHDTPHGCGKSKLRATEAATGDVLMWIDAHQSVLTGDIRRMASDALAQDSIICPGLRNIYYDEAWHPHTVPDSTRVFYPNDVGILPAQTNQYCYSNPRTSVMVGVGLCMSQATYARTGGWNRFAARHGSQERGMALRAYMANIPVLIDAEVLLGHEFFGSTHPSRNPKTGQYRFNNILAPIVNTWHSYLTVCEETTFRTHLYPWFSTYKDAASGEHMLTHPDVLADRARFHRDCKRRSDDELLALLARLATAVPVEHNPLHPRTA